MEEIYLVCAPGLERLLAAEARDAGLGVRGEEPGGVTVEGTLADVARANIVLRTASRVLVRVAQFRATAFHELERSSRAIPWDRWTGPTSVRVRATCRKSKLYHSDAVAERVLAAIERRTGASAAPKVARAVDATDGESDEGVGTQLVVVRLVHDRCTISVDSSGALLHRRGYRQAVGKAPVRETIAAGMLLAAEWTGRTPLVDPLCGSGTIPIEGALLARRITPGAARAQSGDFSFARWPELREDDLSRELARARERELPRAPAPILGSDRDEGVIEAARANAERAGVHDDIAFSARALSAIEPPRGVGLLATNPPYGVRASKGGEVRNLFAQLGKVAAALLPGWRIGVLSPDRALDAQLRIPLQPALELSNGGIRVRYLLGAIPGGDQ
ncbi:MAG: class I SAM-dependent RNA methyltransferase [Gemmatimonadaceae bacterium]|nr:class I SAM-dependent RNA methyltransferase [Gemmatimonadaceae bacterium]NUQ94643.1 class I SAM-dependent RNA methyltransferase [Gemmatimonadaceae bacterium]